MRRFLIILTSAALVAVLALILLSSGIIPRPVGTLAPNGPQQRSFPFTVEYTREEKLVTEAVEPFTISNPLGRIEITGAAVEAVEIVAVQRARAVTAGRAEEILDGISLEAKEGKLTVHLPKTSGSEQAGADLSILVPFEFNLQIQAGLGDVTVKGSQGGLQIRSDLGDITLEHHSAAADLKTSLGNIRIVDSRFPSELKAVTALGNIHLEGFLAEKAVLESKLGNVDILLPPEAAYVLKGEINLGSFNSEVPFQGRKGEKLVEGIIGFGEQQGTLFVKLDLGSLSFKVLHDKKEE